MILCVSISVAKISTLARPLGALKPSHAVQGELINVTRNSRNVDYCTGFNAR